MLNTLLCIILLPFAVCAGLFTVVLAGATVAATAKEIGKAFTREKK